MLSLKSSIIVVAPWTYIVLPVLCRLFIHSFIHKRMVQLIELSKYVGR